MKKLLLTFLIAFITALGANAKTATLTLDGYSKSGTEISSLSLANGDIKISVTKNSDGNGVKYYPANKKDEAAFRLYANASMKFTCNNTNEKITKIEFTMSTSNGTWSNPTSTPTGFNSKTSIWESTDGAQEVTIKNGRTSQARFTKVLITYGGGSGEEKPVLGPIMMESTPVSTNKATPTTTTVKGRGTISFTSANAAAMIVYQDGVKNVSTGGSPITWKAPEATDSEQNLSLRIHSQLQNEGEDLQEKDAYMTVTVPAKGKEQTFELLTDLNDVNEENTYILYGVTTANNGVMSKNLNSKDAFDGLSTYTLTDGVITIPADATDVAIITLESDNSGNEVKYYLKTQDNKYIQTTDKASSLKDTKSEATPFSISVRDAEKHTISIYGGGAYFSYNGTNVNRFRGYGSHQSPTYLYVKRAAQVAPEAPTFTPDGGDVDLYSTVTIACATEGATLTYKIGEGEATAYPADGIKMTKAGKVTITAIATKGRLSTETTKTFNVTDNREEVYVMFDANKYEFTVGEDFESPVAKACTLENEHFVEIPNFTGTINYESDNTSVAEVNATTGALTLKAAGTCKITASLESETYKSDPDHYTLTVNKGLVDGLIEYPVKEFVYTIGSEATLPELVKEPADVDVEYSISHKRVENGVAVYNPATIDEQGNITVNTPGIVTVTATVKANPDETSSYVLEIQSLKEAEIAGTGSATPTGNVYTKVENSSELNHSTLYAILSYSAGKVYALAPENAGANEGLKAVLIKEGETALNSTYTIDNSAVANMLYDENGYLTYDYNSTVYYLTSLSLRHMEWTDKASEAQAITYRPWVVSSGDGTYYDESLLLGTSALLCNPTQGYFNTFSKDHENFNNTLFNCFLYKVGTAMSSASTVKAPVVHITGGNVYYSPDGEWYWGTEDESHKLSFANETDSAKIYYTMTSATPSSANVRAMANSATGTLYTTPFKKSDLDGKKITFWAVKDGQKSAVETLNFNIKTGIEDIDVENAEAIEEEGDARYFNLQGLEVKNPGEGIYIRVANGKATKILKK